MKLNAAYLLNKRKLKPCPFCGREVKIIPHPWGEGFVIEHRMQYGKNMPLCPIATNKGEGTGIVYFETEKEAEKAWNRRYKK